jgi:hypothetical protein
MISQTCFTPPTGVPVELMTHSAVALPWVGTSRVLPVGQLLGLGGSPVEALDTDMLTKVAVNRLRATSDVANR